MDIDAPFSPDQCRSYADDGFVVVRNAFSEAEMADLTGWVDEVANWTDRGLHHHEDIGGEAVLARTEDFLDDHAGLGALLTGVLAAQAGALLGEPAVVFKEKVNFKAPGGGGFAPHQDASAYPEVDHHISVSVPLDPATVASGCLEMVAGRHHDGLFAHERGRIDDAVGATLDWQPAELRPGDLMWFDSYTPHRSATNRSDHPRRALYVTYNAASAGDRRAAYYANKRAAFAGSDGTFGAGERVRISHNDDFLGRPVSPS